MLFRLAYLTVTNAFAVLRLLPMTDRDKDAEILALRHQIGVLQRHLGAKPVTFTPADRAFLAALLQPLPRAVLRRLRLLVRPDTVLRWHRDLIRARHANIIEAETAWTAADRTLHPHPGSAPGTGEPAMGIPAHPR